MEHTSRNILHLGGKIASEIIFSHSSHDYDFYTFSLECKRLSGKPDIINLLLRDTLYKKHQLSPGDVISTVCELRSFNKKTETGSRLIVSGFIKELELCEEELNVNELLLTGTVCKPPVLRETPLGREICDIMLAINRSYGRSDYLPLIIWGRNAHRASKLETGDVISASGRVQSREYIKLIDGEEHLKTAYEVSVSEFESLTPHSV